MKLIDQHSIVKSIGYQEAKNFIEIWHYSHCIPKGSHHLFGWYVHNELYAVADYGNGVNPYQNKYLTRAYNSDVNTNNLLELKRLCRTEPKREEFPLTAFLTRCHRQLKGRGIRFIVAFSDPEYGHNGGIYKAANFEHFGMTQSERHTIDSEGNVHHRRYAYRYAKRNGITIQEARDSLGLEIYETIPKDRWVIEL